MAIEGVSVPSLLNVLDARSDRDPVSRQAARVIRALEIQIVSVENEAIEAEWRALAHAVEISRSAERLQTLARAARRRS